MFFCECVCKKTHIINMQKVQVVTDSTVFIVKPKKTTTCELEKAVVFLP